MSSRITRPAEFTKHCRILGLTTQATIEEVKKAYKKLSLVKHPDKCTTKSKAKANEDFVKINTAKDYLVDYLERNPVVQPSVHRPSTRPPACRGSYRRTSFQQTRSYPTRSGRSNVRAENARKGTASQQTNGFTCFAFSGATAATDGNLNNQNESPNVSNQTEDNRPHRVTDPPVCHNLDISLIDILHGVTRRFKLNRKNYCLRDSLGEPLQEEELIELAIPAGIHTGTQLVRQRVGDRHPNGTPSDAIFTINEKAHAQFRRDANHVDLHYTAVIDWQQATCYNTTIIIPTLEGGTIPWTNRRVIVSGDSDVMQDCGLPSLEAPHSRGDLIVTYQVTHHPGLTPGNMLKLAFNLYSIASNNAASSAAMNHNEQIPNAEFIDMFAP